MLLRTIKSVQACVFVFIIFTRPLNGELKERPSSMTKDKTCTIYSLFTVYYSKLIKACQNWAYTYTGYIHFSLEWRSDPLHWMAASHRHS